MQDLLTQVGRFLEQTAVTRTRRAPGSAAGGLGGGRLSDKRGHEPHQALNRGKHRTPLLLTSRAPQESETMKLLEH